MRKVIYLIACLISVRAGAQDTTMLSRKPITHIQVSNEMFQNNSQFTQKDNLFDHNRPYMTGNGTYWVPGYSNPANSNNIPNNSVAPNTSINPVNTYIQQNLRTNGNTFIIPRNIISR